MRYVFIFNPAAGKGKILNSLIKNVSECCSLHKLEYSVMLTVAAGDAQRIAREQAQKGDEVTIFGAGGEGTVFEILNGIVGYDNVSLGVLPIGSANDFLKFFKKDEKQLFLDVDQQINGKPIKMDIIKANDKYCINGCSVGIDAVVANNMKYFRRLPFVTGGMAYKLAIVKCFFGKIGCKLRLIPDDKKMLEKECLFAVVANGPAYGGGYIAAPDAVPYDGKLNYTIVEKISKLKVLGFLDKYKKGDHKNLSYVSCGNCEKFTISSDVPLPINLDGEIFEHKEITFEIVKGAVKFILPKTISDNILKNEKIKV